MQFSGPLLNEGMTLITTEGGEIQANVDGAEVLQVASAIAAILGTAWKVQTRSGGNHISWEPDAFPGDFPVALDFYTPLHVVMYSIDEEDKAGTSPSGGHDWRIMMPMIRPKIEAVAAYCESRGIEYEYNQDP
jgi:hypothetical protein